MEQPDPKHYNDFLQHSIQILDTLVLSIELPPEIVAAINRQTEQFYEIQEYKFRVEREAQESKRKQIEADGIAAFQKTVSQGISDSYLRWRGIEATLALARSANSKIVVIGSGKDGLPIILGNVDTPPSGRPEANPTEGGTTPTEKSPVPSPGLTVKTPPGSSSTMPDGKPAGGAGSDKAGSSDRQPDAASRLSLSQIEALLSRITDSLHPAGPATNSGAQPKQ